MVWSQTKPNEEGITRQLTAPRRLIVDLLHFAKRVPSLPVERTMHLGPLFVERQGLANRPGWNTVFLKAFALAAVEFPELRTSYLPCPYNRLFEHPCSVASLAIERMVDGDPAILFMKIRCPEEMALWQIEEKVLEAKTRPIEGFSHFRLALGISRFPQVIRRLVWWLTLEWSGKWRARKFGTFGLSSYGALGAESLHPISPLTATLNFGPISPEGTVRVRIVYDHRVCDGAQIARALARIEELLLTTIRKEIAELDFGGMTQLAGKEVSPKQANQPK